MDELTSEQYDKYIRDNGKWNFFANAADLSAVNLAKAFVFSTTILPIYASHLTNSSILIGFIPAILEVGFLLPQIFIARRAETFHRMKPFVVKVSVWERIPYLFLALSVFLWPKAPSWFAYLMLALNIAVASGSGGIATPAWKTMLGKIIHKNSRGLLFALGIGIGGFLGIGGSFITKYLLGNFAYPYSYAYCFSLAFAGQAVSWMFLTFNREPPRAMNPTHTSFREYIKELPQILHGDKNFSRYLFGQLFMILSTMASTFFVLYGKVRFGITDNYAATLTMVALVSQSAGTPLIGWISDRLGHKFVSESSALIGIASLIVALIAPTPTWLAVTFVLANLSRIAMLISRTSITMEFSPLEKLPTYTALSGTLLAAPTFLSPVIAGWLIDAFSYRTSFVVAIACALIGLVISTRGVSDPRVKKGSPN